MKMMSSGKMPGMPGGAAAAGGRLGPMPGFAGGAPKPRKGGKGKGGGGGGGPKFRLPFGRG